MVAAMSMVNYALAQTPQASTPTTQTVQVVTASGNGWINPSGKRDDFSFYASRGTLKADGWRYNPNAQASFTGRDFKTNQVIQVWSTKVWRYKVDKVDGGKRVIIAGIANVKVGQDVRNNWWFRITAKDASGINSKDNFMIQLYRPIGANNAGGWTFKDFKADKPASLHLNANAFYQVQGVLKGGNIAIKP
jgi:hypothetical protein